MLLRSICRTAQRNSHNFFNQIKIERSVSSFDGSAKHSYNFYDINQTQKGQDKALQKSKPKDPVEEEKTSYISFKPETSSLPGQVRFKHKYTS